MIHDGPNYILNRVAHIYQTCGAVGKFSKPRISKGVGPSEIDRFSICTLVLVCMAHNWSGPNFPTFFLSIKD